MIGNQFILGIAAKLIIDLFAGGGGASTGIEQAVGRHPDISVNHDRYAVGMHQANHPQTKHYCEDVFAVCPVQATEGRPVGLLHASPDCTHHSQALGGQPRAQEIRSLAWAVHKWAGKTLPDVITLENVEQMLQWGRLIAKRDKTTGRVITLDRVMDPKTGKKKAYRVADPGEYVPRGNQFLVPDPKTKGRNWEHFVEGLRAMGYKVEWRVICNANLGSHSTRERLYMVARRDGLPIIWPAQSHAKKPRAGMQAWRPVAECVDFSLKGTSIFGRKRPLAEPTFRRIAFGLQKFVLGAEQPFIIDHVAAGLVPVTHSRDTAFDIRDPLRTITTAKGGETALMTATLIQMGYGERQGQAPRVLDLKQPLGTVVAGGNKFGLSTAFMVQANGGFNTTHARDLREPVSAITTSGSQQQLITADVAPAYDLSPEHEEGALRCAAFLMRYHGEGGQWSSLNDPATTITTKDRLALVTVWFKGEPWVIVDICLRMLTPRELYNAQDFPPDYIIDRTADGTILSKTAQVRMCGNSVSPLPMRKIVAANYVDFYPQRAAA